MTVEMKDGNPVNAEELDELRRKVSLTNKMDGTSLYVKLHGRLGKDNPNAWKYRALYNGGIYGRAQCVRLADATHADVYVYVRFVSSR
jgi:hypothetical protein